MCTVMIRFQPGGEWPVLLAAVRDEFMQRAWDAPEAHWPDLPGVVGGRDRVAGGTWMAVRLPDPPVAVPAGPGLAGPGLAGAGLAGTGLTGAGLAGSGAAGTGAAGAGLAGAGLAGSRVARPAVAALLNGVRRGAPADGSVRPTRGTLVLAALSGVDFDEARVPGIADDAELSRYDGFHLVQADAEAVRVWSWDGDRLGFQRLSPGDHIIVNLGADADEDPLVPHFRPVLERTGNPPLPADSDTTTAWAGWAGLLRGGGLALDDPRGLIIAHEVNGQLYGSTSTSLVALAADGRIRYDFAVTPQAPVWSRILPPDII